MWSEPTSLEFSSQASVRPSVTWALWLPKKEEAVCMMKTLPCLFPHKRWCPKFKNNPFFLFYSSLAPLSSYLYNPSSTLLFARWGAAWFINCLMKPMRSSDLLNWIFKDYYLFRETGREGEREGEKDQCVRETSIGCLLHAPKWGLGPHNPGTCPDQESNRRRFGSQASTQSIEPHQPGLNSVF